MKTGLSSPSLPLSPSPADFPSPGVPCPPGLLLLDKPSGPTSHDAVLWARRVLSEKHLGHCGSLDPMATGLLLLGVGEALSWQDRLMAEQKVYEGRLRLGLCTDTDDVTGKTVPLSEACRRAPERGAVSEDELRTAFRRFLGPQEQRVPLYSAVKVKGRRLYEMAREGERVDLPRKTVEIYSFDLLAYEPPEASFRVECSKGTYVRALARDVGEMLGTGAALAALSREGIGPFRRAGAYVWKGEKDVRWADVARAFVPLRALSEAL